MFRVSAKLSTEYQTQSVQDIWSKMLQENVEIAIYNTLWNRHERWFEVGPTKFRGVSSNMELSGVPT